MRPVIVNMIFLEQRDQLEAVVGDDVLDAELALDRLLGGADRPDGDPKGRR